MVRKQTHVGQNFNEILHGIQDLPTLCCKKVFHPTFNDNFNSRPSCPIPVISGEHAINRVELHCIRENGYAE